uniref:Uncharacterized protein n=1 Tax=uncultured marine virus TaxID=186617 RepID=A0A0F7L6A4_9VIRU|nr:hypothetical protein [uncultured marine virus]
MRGGAEARQAKMEGHILSSAAAAVMRSCSAELDAGFITRANARARATSLVPRESFMSVFPSEAPVPCSPPRSYRGRGAEARTETA